MACGNNHFYLDPTLVIYNSKWVLFIDDRCMRMHAQSDGHSLDSRYKSFSCHSLDLLTILNTEWLRKSDVIIVSYIAL